MDGCITVPSGFGRGEDFVVAQGLRWEEAAKMTLVWPLLGRFSFSFAMDHEEEAARVPSFSGEWLGWGLRVGVGWSRGSNLSGEFLTHVPG
jgi:hypothetical protein